MHLIYHKTFKPESYFIFFITLLFIVTFLLYLHFVIKSSNKTLIKQLKKFGAEYHPTMTTKKLLKTSAQPHSRIIDSESARRTLRPLPQQVF